MNIKEELFSEILKAIKKDIPTEISRNTGVKTFIDKSTENLGFKKITKNGIVP